MSEERCETCRYGQKLAMTLDGTDRYCRRLPPVRIGVESFYAKFPLVLSTDWCGEWRPISLTETPR